MGDSNKAADTAWKDYGYKMPITKVLFKEIYTKAFIDGFVDGWDYGYDDREEDIQQRLI